MDKQPLNLWIAAESLKAALHILRESDKPEHKAAAFKSIETVARCLEAEHHNAKGGA